MGYVLIIFTYVISYNIFNIAYRKDITASSVDMQ